MCDDGTTERATIASYVEPHALGRKTRAALHGLGYEIVPASTRGRFSDPRFRPQLRLVDERHLDLIPSIESDPETPVLLLCGARVPRVDDPRIAGVCLRPARLASLYPLIQHALERTPRVAPRVETLISARVSHADQRYAGRLESLSATGCRLDVALPLEPGIRVNLQFALPGVGFVMVRAECLHATDLSHGLRFCDVNDDVQRVISAYVTQRLATLRAVA